MYSSQTRCNVPASQTSENTTVAHHPYYATPTQSYSNAQLNAPHYTSHGRGAYPSAGYPVGTPGSMMAHGLPVFPPPSYPQLYNLPDPAPCIRELLSIPPNAPIHLSSLIDEPIRHGRPGYTIKQLAAVAIYASQDGRATLGEIKNALMARYEYFRTDKALVDTLKSALSVNDLFSQPKPSLNEPVMKGSFWVVDVRNPTGHRPRKRGIPSRAGDSTNSDVST
ncbi:hypothetical protein ARMGADRAFT_1114655 [Armillaria gallica]|uniref:Fork-head domain-containing protein n=1 Tax=Armillaria gallica TaxID=47427 RepID=A0A2H3D2B8_ARMGA|nr:hypothetical protein ARMGADRAFT_1114655 [Armillaria gallica]